MTFIAYFASFMFCLNSLYLLMDYYHYAHMTTTLLIQHTQTSYAQAGLNEYAEILQRTESKGARTKKLSILNAQEPYSAGIAIKTVEEKNALYSSTSGTSFYERTHKK